MPLPQKVGNVRSSASALFSTQSKTRCCANRSRKTRHGHSSRLGLGSREEKMVVCSPLSASSSESTLGSAESSAAALEKAFGIPGSVAFEEGRGGLVKAVLTHVCGSSTEVYLYGANVLSWKQPSGDEVLYVRPDSKFDMSKAISGEYRGKEHSFRIPKTSTAFCFSFFKLCC